MLNVHGLLLDFQVVFEVMGIICYKDEKGEMVCEGYDEGPRYSMQEFEEEVKHDKYIRFKPIKN